jgi:transposase
MRRSRRRYPPALKLEAVERIAKGERVAVVSEDLKIGQQRLSDWCRQYQAGGPEGLRGPGRPRREEAQTARGRAALRRGHEGEDELSAARRQIGELQRQVGEQQRKVGEQELDLDFFRAALRRVKEIRQRPTGGGALAYTKSSRR